MPKYMLFWKVHHQFIMHRRKETIAEPNLDQRADLHGIGKRDIIIVILCICKVLKKFISRV